uniref:Uncharacterized protein n=1 Tax=Zooxanthella nutricula TaxID=1333877 RepID=A0A7S2QJP3_9DINO
MLGIHDLLLFGYWGVMTEGPQMEAELARRRDLVVDMRETDGDNCDYSQTLYRRFEKRNTLAEEDAQAAQAAFPGLAQTQQAAVNLALLVQDLHPWRSCREAFAQNVREWQQCNRTGGSGAKWEYCDDLELVTKQAAEAWACVGVKEDMITVTCNGLDEDCTGEPITSLRDPEGGSGLKQVSNAEPYRNYIINGDEVSSPLGACWQGGPDKEGYATGETKWLRACSFWTAFHSMALRADALGGDLPNQLFGTIIRLVAGGALWCGG